MLHPHLNFKNYGSKEGQDLFVQKLIPNKGFFLDIGCEHPISGSNTWQLEKMGWTGILIDKSQKYMKICKRLRTSPTFCLDVTKLNWNNFLQELNCPNIIDYISLDVDECNLNVIQKFPLNNYEFKIMTLETDVYKLGNKIKSVSDKVLSSYDQYYQAAENVSLVHDGIFEDWWCNKKYFSIGPYKNLCWKEIIENVKSI